MSLGLRRDGQAIGIEPKIPTVVYANRAQVGDWERVTIEPAGDGLVSVRFLATNLQLAITPDGKLEPRPAGAIGEWEKFTISADRKTLSRVGVTLTIEGGLAPAPSSLRLEVRGNDFVDATGARIVLPAVDAFLAFRQYRDGGPDALAPFFEESTRLGFTAWRIWAQGSKRQNGVIDLSPTEAGYYDDVRPCTDLINAHGIVPIWTGYVDNQDVQSPPEHWTRLGERLVGSASIASMFNQFSKNRSTFGPYDLGPPADGVLWSRGSDVEDTQTPPRGAPLSELHATRTSFDRALMDATASPPNMRAVGGSTVVMMTEGNPFGDDRAYTERQAWMLGRAYSIDWGCAVFHNRQSQAGRLMTDETARRAAAWVKGMRLG